MDASLKQIRRRLYFTNANKNGALNCLCIDAHNGNIYSVVGVSFDMCIHALHLCVNVCNVKWFVLFRIQSLLLLPLFINFFFYIFYCFCVCGFFLLLKRYKSVSFLPLNSNHSSQCNFLLLLFMSFFSVKDLRVTKKEKRKRNTYTRFCVLCSLRLFAKNKKKEKRDKIIIKNTQRSIIHRKKQQRR